MTKQRKDDTLKIRLSAHLKADVLKATAESGGASKLVRELLTAYLEEQKKRPAHR